MRACDTHVSQRRIVVVRSPLLFLALLAPFAFGACTDSRATRPSGLAPERACTLIACRSGVDVVFSNPPAAATGVEVCVDMSCRSAGARRSFVVFVPANARVARSRPVTVRVRVLAGRSILRERSLRLRLRTLRPNGGDCPPVCVHRSLRFSGDRLRAVD
jgi:hypothetical protein